MFAPFLGAIAVSYPPDLFVYFCDSFHVYQLEYEPNEFYDLKSIRALSPNRPRLLTKRNPAKAHLFTITNQTDPADLRTRNGKM